MASARTPAAHAVAHPGAVMSRLPVLLIGATLLLSSCAMSDRSEDTGGMPLDKEGFIVDWLMLAPFAIPESSGGDEIDKVQLTKEGSVTPKAGDTAKVGDKDGTWKAVKAKDYELDFNVALGGPHEDVLGYLVAYVVADKELTGVTAAIGSNDESKLYLNGKEIYKFAETRTIAKDTDKIPGLTLHKGVNTVVFKVINEKNDWAAALRFLDKEGKPVSGLSVKLAP
jgi:hypothetical protein